MRKIPVPLDRLRYLDGLRGVAAMMVVIYHFSLAFYPSTYTRSFGDVHISNSFEWLLHDTPGGIFFNGGLAVALFLLLSGFVASVQFKRSNTLIKIGAVIFKRFIRFILPIFVINLLVYFLLLYNLKWNYVAAQSTFSWWWLGKMWQIGAHFQTVIVQSLGSLFVTYPIETVYNSSVWTMPFFFMGSVFVLLLLWLTIKYSWRGWFYLIATLLLLRSNYWLLIMGMVLEQYRFNYSRLFHKVHLRSVLLPIILFFGNYPQNYSTAYLSQWYHWLPILPYAHTSTFYQGIAAIACLILILTTSYIQQLLCNKIWLFLGKISFSLYLFHIVVINSLSSLLFITLLDHFQYHLSFGITFLISLPIIIGGSWLIYLGTEKQVNAVTNHLFKMIATIYPYASR